MRLHHQASAMQFNDLPPCVQEIATRISFFSENKINFNLIIFMGLFQKLF